MSNRSQSEIDVQKMPESVKDVLTESAQYCIENNIHAVSPNVMTLILLKKEKIQKELRENQMNFDEVIQGIDYFLKTNFSGRVDIDENNVTYDLETGKILTSLLLNQTFSEGTVSIKQWDILCEIKEVEGTFLNQLLNADEETAKKARQVFRTQEQKQEDLDEEVQELFAQFTTDYTALAKEGHLDPVIGRDVEIHEMTEILARKKKNNIVMLGKAGTGKTSIIEGIALAIVDETAPEILLNKTVISIDTAGLLAGTKYRGEFEDRCRKIFDAIAAQKNMILFIDEAHTVMGAGESSSGGIDLANMMKPKLARGDLSCIMATTHEEYRKTIQKDAAMVRRLQTYTINEPTYDHMIQIINGLKEVYEKHHQVTYDDDIAKMAMDFGTRYMHNKANPDKSIDILDASGAYARVNGITHVTVAEVMKVVSKMTNIPTDAMTEGETNVFKGLDERIKERVFSQDEVVDQVVEEIVVAKAGLKETNKPMGSFLLVGTSGCGKTEFSRALADQLNIPLIKYDMSEYQESHSVSKLIGTSPGYVGYDDNSAKLIDDISDNPNCVLLLDEVEKAHPKVLSVLLQVMDDAVLSGSNGKVANFKNVIILMTSNLGAREANRETIGFNSKRAGKTNINKEVERFFPPEFINRMNGQFVFNNLDHESMIKIVRKEIDSLNNKLNDRKIKVEFTEDAIEWLAKEGFDDAMGARPLQRLFSDKVKKQVSKRLVLEELEEGSVLNVNLDDDNLTVS